MKTAIITGSAGLIGAEACRFFSEKGYRIIGVDNDMRKEFFGAEASTDWQRRELEAQLTDYKHYPLDIRDIAGIEKLFADYSSDIEIVIHTAAQPSHDWAAKDPHKDFTVNANGTLTLLEAARKFCTESSLHFHLNKQGLRRYSQLPAAGRTDKRWEISKAHAFFEHGIDETMSIDNTKHSLFGASKVAADVLVQEYGKYFQYEYWRLSWRLSHRAGAFGYSAAWFSGIPHEMRCDEAAVHDFGYKGKQVRDNIHSFDLVNMFWHFRRNHGRAKFIMQAAVGTAIVRCKRPLKSANAFRATRCRSNMMRIIASAITSGMSAMYVSFSSIFPNGNTATLSKK
jgi:CDP-paratose 2-epimerase